MPAHSTPAPYGTPDNPAPEGGGISPPPCDTPCISLGQTYRDRVTGFMGIATSHAKYLTGTPRTELSAEVRPDGSMIEPQWFDDARLDVATVGNDHSAAEKSACLVISAQNLAELVVVIRTMTGAGDTRPNRDQILFWVSAAHKRGYRDAGISFLVTRAVAREVLPGVAAAGGIYRLDRIAQAVSDRIELLAFSESQKASGQ